MSLRNRSSTGLAALADLARQDWRQAAACIDARLPDGTAAPFIDPPDVEVAEYLVRRFCHRCEVVGPCSEYGEAEGPKPWPAIYGARYRPSSKRKRAAA